MSCTTHVANYGLVQPVASLDQLEVQQTQYFEMMTQANAHILAQLQ